MTLYVTTRQFPTRRRQYEVGDPVTLTNLASDERLDGFTSGAVVEARFVGTAAELTRKNPTPGPGAVCYATDTGELRIGDGVTAYASLTAITGGGGGAVSSVVGQTGAVTGTQILADSTVSAALAAKAPLASPTFTGTPAAPTASALTGTTQIATTAYVDTADGLNAKKASNLSDLASASTARTNLGLGNSATLNVGTTAGTVAAGNALDPVSQINSLTLLR